MTVHPKSRSAATVSRVSTLVGTVVGACLCLAWPFSAVAQSQEAAAPVQPPSRLDAPLFYQLLIGELELRLGEPGTAYAVLLDAARRTRDETLFERAVDIALRAQAGNEALNAANAWRQAHPASLAAVRAQVRILLALNRLPALIEPLRRLIELTPDEDRPGAVAALPRLLRAHPDPRAALQLLQSLLIPLAERPDLRTPAQLALARGLMQAGQFAPALSLARDVAQRLPDAPGPALLAVEMLGDSPEAEPLVRSYLEQPKAEPLVRQSYAQWLAQRQQHGLALVQLRLVTQAMPDSARAWFQLGVVAAEAQDRAQATAALTRFLELDAAQRQASRPAATSTPDAAASGSLGEPSSASETTDGDGESRGADALRTRAMLLLAQLATDQGDYAAALRWLKPLEGQTQRLDIQARRALVLARQGKVDQARALIRAVPESRPADALYKSLAEAQLLRTLERWKDARALLMQVLEQHPQDTDLLYELAMVLERMGRHDEMERHLRRIIELRPDHPHAHNALGYSLADRGIRLEEAYRLIERALALSPGDPYITDSLAWVVFRQGQAGRAAELLRQAYAARPDTEIGAHLGEVLWTLGQRDEARRIWRESRDRDARNKVLRDTLARLKVDL
jgi:predicted Zn-dependent protease